MSQGDESPKRSPSAVTLQAGGAPKRLPPAMPGTWIRGKYRLDSILGQGGMATVFAATHRNKKRFAVKMLHPELSAHEVLRSRFLREGYVANTVEHPGAVAVLDDDITEEGAAFLVMELLDGSTLEWLRERSGGKLGVKAALCIADQLLDVLAAAHARSVVHRDIKPANLFVTRDGQLKVLDFGIARLREEGPTSGTTSTGVALGTPAYMSPEQARGKTSQIDARTDVWAVGATIFALVAGREARESAESAQEMMVIAATTPVPGLATVAPDVPEGVARVVDRALAFAIDERFASATEMREAVRQEYRALFGGATSSEPLETLLATSHRISTTHVDFAVSASQAISAPTLDAQSSKEVVIARARPGATTSEPVSSAREGPPRSGGRWALVAGAIATAGLAVVIARVAGWGTSSGPAATGGGAASAPASAATALATPVQSVAPPVASLTPPAAEASSLPALPASPVAAPRQGSPNRPHPATPAASPPAPSRGAFDRQ